MIERNNTILGPYDVQAISDALDQALRGYLPPAMDTPEARVLCIATCLQESRGIHRRQLVTDGEGRLVPGGPASGLGQFERGGGCSGVLRHQASRFWMFRVCEARGCPPQPAMLWEKIQHDDVLALAAVRLLFFTDAKRIPRIDDAGAAWAYYLRVWRPGKPHHATWAECCRIARAAVVPVEFV